MGGTGGWIDGTSGWLGGTVLDGESSDLMDQLVAGWVKIVTKWTN